jgi:hypothetical protein
MVDHRAGVGRQAGHGASEMMVDLHDFLDGIGLEQGRLNAFLDCEDDAVGGADADCC